MARLAYPLVETGFRVLACQLYRKRGVFVRLSRAAIVDKVWGNNRGDQTHTKNRIIFLDVCSK